jgi:hypothetical protein
MELIFHQLSDDDTRETEIRSCDSGQFPVSYKIWSQLQTDRQVGFVMFFSNSFCIQDYRTYKLWVSEEYRFCVWNTVSNVAGRAIFRIYNFNNKRGYLFILRIKQGYLHGMVLLVKRRDFTFTWLEHTDVFLYMFFAILYTSLNFTLICCGYEANKSPYRCRAAYRQIISFRISLYFSHRKMFRICCRF